MSIDYKQMLQRFRKGEKVSVLAEKFGITGRRVRQIAQEAGLTYRKRSIEEYKAEKRGSPWCDVDGEQYCYECEHTRGQHWKYGCVAQYITRARNSNVMATCQCLVTHGGGWDKRSCINCSNFVPVKGIPHCNVGIEVVRGIAVDCADYDEVRDARPEERKA